MQHIAKNVVLVNDGKSKFQVSLLPLKTNSCCGVGVNFELRPLQAVKNKYSSSRLLRVSLIPQLRSPVVNDMAAALLSNP